MAEEAEAEYNELYGDAGEVAHIVNLHESAQPHGQQITSADGAPVVDNLTMHAGHLQHQMPIVYDEDDDFNIQLDQPDLASEAIGLPSVRAQPRGIDPVAPARAAGAGLGGWQPRGWQPQNAYPSAQLPAPASQSTRPLYVPAGATSIEADDTAAFPMAAKPKQPIKLPGQTRVTPEEYREFLSLGHGHIFDLDIDRVVDAAWRMPGADATDFFNYGMDIRKWKEYAGHVQQYRLEYRMQHKISTYEAEFDADLDPDLPPELAAALAVERRQASADVAPMQFEAQFQMGNGRRPGPNAAHAAPGAPFLRFNAGFAQRQFNGMQSEFIVPQTSGGSFRPALQSNNTDERSGMQEGIAAVEAARQQESVPPQEADIQQAYPGSSAVHGLAHSLQGWDGPGVRAPSEAFPPPFLPAPFLMGAMHGLALPFGHVMPGLPPPFRSIEDSNIALDRGARDGGVSRVSTDDCGRESRPDERSVKRQRTADQVPSGSLAMGMDAPMKSSEGDGGLGSARARPPSRSSNHRRGDSWRDMRSSGHEPSQRHTSGREQSTREWHERDSRESAEARRRHRRHEDNQEQPLENHKSRDRSRERSSRNRSDRRRKD